MDLTYLHGVKDLIGFEGFFTVPEELLKYEGVRKFYSESNYIVIIYHDNLPEVNI